MSGLASNLYYLSVSILYPRRVLKISISRNFTRMTSTGFGNLRDKGGWKKAVIRVIKAEFKYSSCFKKGSQINA